MKEQTVEQKVCQIQRKLVQVELIVMLPCHSSRGSGLISNRLSTATNHGQLMQVQYNGVTWTTSTLLSHSHLFTVHSFYITKPYTLYVLSCNSDSINDDCNYNVRFKDDCTNKRVFFNMTVNNMYVVEQKTPSMTLDQFYYNLHKLCFVSTRYYFAN